VIKTPMILFDSKKQKLDLLINNINESMRKTILEKINKLELLKASYVIKTPHILYEKKKTYFSNLIEKLELVNPLGILTRGYSVTYHNEKILLSAKKLKKGDKIDIRLADGNIKAVVELVKEN
jgi:exodeoxyribonuclease VII large subunit